MKYCSLVILASFYVVMSVSASSNACKSCHKQPYRNDIPTQAILTPYSGEQQADNQNLCPCGNKPRTDEPAPIKQDNITQPADTQSLCPCGNKPRTDEPAAAQNNTTPSGDNQNLCPCSGKPHKKAKCPCGNKPRAQDIIKLYNYLHNQPILQLVSEKCPCAQSHHHSKPHHKELVVRICTYIARNPQLQKLSQNSDKCGCAPKPHKESANGAALFLEGTHAIMNCVEGGIISHNTGNLKDGLPYIIQGITLLADIASRSPNPTQVYQQVHQFIANCDKEELNMLLDTVKAHAA